MKKIFVLFALGLSMMAQAVELDYYKTLVDEQADATKGTTQLYNLDYYADGSLLVLASYQTATSEEVGLHFEGQTYQGGTAARWNLANTMNAFLAKLDKEGNVLWAVPDTTYYFDLGGSASVVTADGGAIFVQKMKNRKGRYVTFINKHDKTSLVTESNNITASYERTADMTADPTDSYAWTGVAEDENGNVYLAGYQADTLFPTWKDTIPMRPNTWNGNSQNKSTSCNTIIIKYNNKMEYVGATAYMDGLTYDRPVGLHYENGNLYVAGTYNDGTTSGLYASRLDTADLHTEYHVQHPVTGSLQFQMTKFVDGKIYICGALGKNGSITIGNKEVVSGAGANNYGLVYVMNQADGAVVDAAVHVPADNTLNITVAAFPTTTDYVAYNHETLNGIQTALNYDANMNLISADTIGHGGGSSTISVVDRSADGKQTAVGLRARTTGGDYYLLNEEPMNFTTTNWYSLIAVLKPEESQGFEDIEAEYGKAVKFIQNGQMYIRYNGRTYNVLGL